MDYLAVDKEKNIESLFIGEAPVRDKENEHWVGNGDYIILPNGSIKKIIGHELSWEDEPVALMVIPCVSCVDNGTKIKPSCQFCDSFESGWCTNYGKKVHETDICDWYRSTIVGVDINKD